jgi:hypothetical protein
MAFWRPVRALSPHILNRQGACPIIFVSLQKTEAMRVLKVRPLVQAHSPEVNPAEHILPYIRKNGEFQTGTFNAIKDIKSLYPTKTG